MLETFTKLKKRILSPLVSLVMKLRKNIKSMYQKKNIVKKTCQLVIDGRNWQKSITFMYYHTL